MTPSRQNREKGLEKRADGFLARSAIFRGHPAAVRCFPAYRQAAAGFVEYLLPAEVAGIGGLEIYIDFSRDTGKLIRDDFAVVSSGSGNLEPRFEELCTIALGFRLDFREDLSGGEGFIVCDIDITAERLLFLDDDVIKIGRAVSAVENTVFSAAAIPPLAAHRQFSGFYILHGTVGVYAGVFRDGFSVEQHHRGVAETIGAARET